MSTYLKLLTGLSLGAMFLLSACASTDPHMASTAMPAVDEAELMELQQTVSDQQSMLAQKESELEAMTAKARAAELAARQAETMAREAQAVPAPTFASGSAMDSLFPPNAEPGACYARIFVPAKYKTVTEQVLAHEAKEHITIIPAKYETVQEQVLVKEASQRLETIPAKYGWVEEKVMVKPATQRLVEVPAKYETISEKVMVKPAYTVWKKGTGPIQRIDESTGEIMCLVEMPAEYRTVSKQVLKSSATTRMVEEPAVYKTVKKRVMLEPPSTRTVQIPAEYKTVAVTKLVSPAQEKKTTIPAQYQTVTKKVKIDEDHMEWREILCETNMTTAKITEIQRALAEAGYDPGPIDGVVGSQTMRAVNAFQKDKNLVVTRYLTINTVKALGVK